jgi:hypothetical protein
MEGGHPLRWELFLSHASSVGLSTRSRLIPPLRLDLTMLAVILPAAGCGQII